FIDVAKYNVRIMGAAHVRNVADLACRTALSYRAVAHITFPVDLQEQDVPGEPSKRNVPGHTSEIFARGGRLPDETDLHQAAELLAAPIVKALLGKAAVPDDSPFVTGSIGLLGTRPSQEALEDCDTLLMVGTSFPYVEFLPKPGQARCVQIELDPMRVGLRYPVEVGLVGDSQRTLRALNPLLERKDDRKFLEPAQQRMKGGLDVVEERG